jgi:hypothetical protein
VLSMLEAVVLVVVLAAQVIDRHALRCWKRP